MRTARTDSGRYYGGIAGARAAAVTVCLLLAAGPVLASETRQSLFIQWGGHFSDKLQPIWVARVESGERNIEQTTVLLKEDFGEPDYEKLQPFAARTLAVTSDSTELVLLLENRAWLWLSADRFSYGPPLPGEARGAGQPQESRIITLAGNRKSLWALGEANRNRPTVSSTTRAAAPPTTAPATRPTEPRIYSLAGEGWKRYPAQWLEGTTPSQWAHVSMAVVGEMPCVALPEGDRAVASYRLAQGGASWERIGLAHSAKPITRLKMLDLMGTPAVWIFGESGMGRIWTESRDVTLKLDGPAPQPEEVDLTIAGPAIRCVFIRDDQLMEQRYALNGVPDGKPTVLAAKAYSSGAPFNWPAVMALAAAAILIFMTFFRRRSETQGDEEQ